MVLRAKNQNPSCTQDGLLLQLVIAEQTSEDSRGLHTWDQLPVGVQISQHMKRVVDAFPF